MAEAFADTFFFLSLVNPDDPYYIRAVELSKSTDRMVTTEWVLLELADSLASGRRDSFITVRDGLLSNPSVIVVPFDLAIYEESISLYSNRPDKRWSLTDCTSFVVMGHRRLREALTGDHHFTQAGFDALFRR